MEVTINRITSAYRWFFRFMVCAVASSLVFLPIVILENTELRNRLPLWTESVLGITGFFAFIFFASASLFSWILLFRSWQIIQDDKPRTTPAKAVGYCFIPVFNLFWIYIAFYSLSRHLNKRAKQLHINIKLVPTFAALIFCSWSWILLLTARVLQEDPWYNNDLLAIVTVTLNAVIYFTLLWVLMFSFAKVSSAIVAALTTSVT